jgi:16S rRNA (uracil1498-N3)-methyltransferase
MNMNAYKNLIRLYAPQEAPVTGGQCALSERQLHYLRNVMRCNPGDTVRVFDGTNGEWLAKLEEINKKSAVVSFVEKIREQAHVPDIHVLASPVKKDALDFMVEKASELGAKAFFPVTCERTVINRINEDRLQTIAVEAAEQCERLDIMRVQPLQSLKSLLETWHLERKLFFCIERSAAPMILARLQSDTFRPPLAVLIGPEGGFTDAETEMLTAMASVEPVSLGGRILRAETALVSALTCLQAVAGDWSAK